MKRSHPVYVCEFDSLPPEVIPLIVDAVCSASEDPFYALYRQLPQVSRLWHRACGGITSLSIVNNTYWTRLVLHHLSAHEQPLSSSLHHNAEDFVHTVRRVQKACSSTCRVLHRSTQIMLPQFVVHLVKLCSAQSLSHMTPLGLATPINADMADFDNILTPQEAFTLGRTLYRQDYETYMRSDTDGPFPPKNSPLITLFLRLECDDERRVVYVPLWALRHSLTQCKAGYAATQKAEYQSLYHNGRRLMPESYNRWEMRLTSARQLLDSRKRYECWSERTLYSLSPEEQTAFLLRHATIIEERLFDPRYLWCHHAHKPSEFARRLDVEEPLREEDVACGLALVRRLTALIVKTHPDSWFERELTSENPCYEWSYSPMCIADNNNT